MTKIRIVHIVPMLMPGGAERVAVHIVSSLNRQRYQPTVISFSDRANCDLDRLLDEAGINVRYLGKRPGFDYRMYYRLGPVLRECQPDIVHTHLHVLRYAMPFLLSMKGVGLLHTVHNLAKREIEPRMRWLQRYALKNGIVPVAVAEEVAVSLQQTYGIPACRVITNGIPTGSYSCPQVSRSVWRAKEGFRESDILFVCVARFAPQKNHALLLNAFAQGLAADSGAHLVLVGEGLLRRQLEEQARKLGLAPRVHFLGLRSDIPNVLGAMDVFVLSSDWEGHPLSIMEGMAAGLPVVSTAVGGVPQMFEAGKQGVLVPPGDALELANSMRWLSRDHDARRAMGLAAARLAREKYDISTTVKAYEEVYQALLARTRDLRTQAFMQPATYSEEVVGTRNE